MHTYNMIAYTSLTYLRVTYFLLKKLPVYILPMGLYC